MEEQGAHHLPVERDKVQCNHFIKHHGTKFREGTGSHRCFPFTKNVAKILLGFSVWEECIPFVTSSIRGS